MLGYPLFFYSQATPVVGTWQHHFGPRVFSQIEKIGNDLYSNGEFALYRFDSKKQEVDILNKPRGLSDYYIQTIRFDESSKRLVVVYENSIIDMIDFSSGNTKIESNYDIYNKIFIGRKNINEIKFIADKVYFASTLGIIVLDYKNNDIKETYVIGDNGVNANVFSVDKFKNKFYAITNYKLKEAIDNQAINLQNYASWTINSSMPNDSFEKMIASDNYLYCFTSKKLYQFDGTNYTVLKTLDSNKVYHALKKINNEIYTIYHNKDTQGNVIGSKIEKISNNNVTSIYQINDRILDFTYSTDNELFVSGNGVYKVENNNSKKYVDFKIAPYREAYRLQYVNNRLILNTGILKTTVDAYRIYSGYYEYLSYGWNHAGLWTDPLNKYQTHMSLVERNDERFRAFVFGGLVKEQNGTTTVFDSRNSLLEGLNQENNITDMQLDKTNNTIWLTAKNGNTPLKSIDVSGKWRNHPITKLTPTTEIRKLFIDKYGNKWLLTRNQGIVFFNEKDIDDPNDDVMYLIKNINTGDCKLDVSSSYCIAEDKYDNIWVGSDKGIAAIYGCNYNINEPCSFNIPGQTIKNPNNPSDSTYECAFLNSQVTAMAIDGGNRMWIGTAGSIFYLDEGLSVKYEGISSEFLKFTEVNSPFPGKAVYDILVHPKTGEVFFSTEIGLVSYVGQSTAEYNENASNLFVTPNPVPKDYHGLISLDGMPDNSIFKITDNVGNLIYQGRTNGTRIVWDGVDLNGKRPPTGVYFVFAAQNGTQNGAIKRVGTFTIIN